MSTAADEVKVDEANKLLDTLSERFVATDKARAAVRNMSLAN